MFQPVCSHFSEVERPSESAFLNQGTLNGVATNELRTKGLFFTSKRNPFGCYSFWGWFKGSQHPPCLGVSQFCTPICFMKAIYSTGYAVPVFVALRPWLRQTAAVYHTVGDGCAGEKWVRVQYEVWADGLGIVKIWKLWFPLPFGFTRRPKDDGKDPFAGFHQLDM